MSYPSRKDADGNFSVPRNQILTFRATDDGTPTGAFQIIGDYSASPALFYAEVPVGQEWHVTAITAYISGAGNITANGYGPISGLTNGVQIRFETPAGDPLTPPFPAVIKRNGNYQAIGFELVVLDTGAGINHVTFTQKWVATIGTALVLKATDRFAVRVNDDFTALTEHNFLVSGFWLSTP